MANKTVTKEATNQVPALAQLTVVEHQEFNNIISTATVKSAELERIISNLFGSAFDDFAGSKIILNPAVQNDLKVKLYFKPVMNKSEDGSYAVKVRGEGVAKPSKKGNLTELVNTINMLATSKQFELSDIAQELLAEFLIISDAKIVDRYDANLGKVVKVRLPKNWNAYTEEVVDPIDNTRYSNPYFAVTLDLLLVVAKLYGKKDEKELKELADKGAIPRDRYQYAVNLTKILNPTSGDYILEIRRIDLKELNKLTQSVGYGSIPGRIPMTRPER